MFLRKLPVKSTTGTLSSKENLDVSSLGFPAGLEVISIYSAPYPLQIVPQEGKRGDKNM